MSSNDATVLRFLFGRLGWWTEAYPPYSPHALGAAYIDAEVTIVGLLMSHFLTSTETKTIDAQRLRMSIDNLVRLRLLVAYPTAVTVAEFMKTNMHCHSDALKQTSI